MAKPSKNKNIHQVRQVKANTRLTDYCAKHFPILGSRTAAKKAIAAGQILLNNEKATITDLVKQGDKIKLLATKTPKAKFKKIDVAIEIIFEDDYLIIVNKPGGIAVNGNRDKTVENAVIPLAKRSTQVDALPRPTAVHRIDVPTKGLVLLAKTKTALIQLSKAFQNNQVKKNYYAIVHGQTAEQGSIDMPIEGKKSVTEYERIDLAPSRLYEYFSLLKLTPITGRTHQLRIHLRSRRHLIVGDKMYAKGQHTILGKGLFLCSCRLAFTHPITKEAMNFEIEPPARFSRLMEREKERF